MTDVLQHRQGTVRLTLLTPRREALANQAVTVCQTRHRFLFGGYSDRLARPLDDLEASYRERFTEIFNFATLPFYWSGFEPQPGQPLTEQRQAMANWCRAHGIRAKGHPLVYHMTTPAWAGELPFAEMKARQFARITRDVTAFAGLVDFWDVINETVWTPRHEDGKHPLARLCRRLGRVGLVKQSFDLAHAADPRAQLVINDCDPIPAYHRLVRESLAAGAPIDIVGIQSHMHKGYWPTEKTRQVCDDYARLGKPLHFSELTILSGIIQPNHSWSQRRDDWFTTPAGEELQARQVEEFYRLLFACPAVQGITWWNLSDDQAWLGAPAGLVRKDMTPKPAYEVLRKLIKGEWWTAECVLQTDARGQVTWTGLLGDYTVTAARKTVAFSINNRLSETSVVLS